MNFSRTDIPEGYNSKDEIPLWRYNQQQIWVTGPAIVSRAVHIYSSQEAGIEDVQHQGFRFGHFNLTDDRLTDEYYSGAIKNWEDGLKTFYPNELSTATKQTSILHSFSFCVMPVLN